MMIKNKFNGYSGDGRRLYPSGGGGSTPAKQTVETTSIPAYARPYVESMLGEAWATANQGYTPYPRDRIAEFSPLQQQVQEQAANYQSPWQTDAASGLASDVAARAAQAGQYQAGVYGNQFQAPESYRAGVYANQFQAPQAYATGQFSSQNVRAPWLQNYQMQGPGNVTAAQTQAAQLAASPAAQAALSNYGLGSLQQYQMAGPEKVSADTFLQPGTASAYMSPYMQNVVDTQSREAIRQSNIMQQQQNAQAVQAGAFGGSRQALIEAERQRNLGTQLGDIQATGSQSAFQNAQQQFNAEQNARLQASLANQGAGLTAGQQNLAALLGVQSLGYQGGLQQSLANAAAQNQMSLANQALAGQYGLQQGQFGQQANLANQQAAMQAMLANQQMGYNVGSQNLAAMLGIQQLGAGQNLQAQLANQQANQWAQQQAEQSRQFGSTQGLTSAQLAAQYGLAGQQLSEQSRQYGYGQDMTAAQAAAQYGLAGQQLGEQSRQFGANLGLQGLQQQLAAAGLLGNLGQQQYGQDMGIMSLQNQLGGQQQALQQQIMAQQYQDFLNQRGYQQQQLGWFSDMLRGLPLTQQTSSMYQAPPSLGAQLGGMGMAMYGANYGGYAKGGLTSVVAHKLMQG